MEQFNKALSFILGLIVVAVFIIFASGKYNIKTPTSNASNTSPQPTSKSWFSFGQPKATPTPTNTPVAIVKNTNKDQTQSKQDTNYHLYSNSSTPSNIPNTGVPIVLFPLLGTSLLTGIFMKKAGKRD